MLLGKDFHFRIPLEWGHNSAPCLEINENVSGPISVPLPQMSVKSDFFTKAQIMSHQTRWAGRSPETWWWGVNASGDRARKRDGLTSQIKLKIEWEHLPSCLRSQFSVCGWMHVQGPCCTLWGAICPECSWNQKHQWLWQMKGAWLWPFLLPALQNQVKDTNRQSNRCLQSTGQKVLSPYNRQK